MPSTYFHYRYGKDIFKLLPQQTQKLIEQSRELYDIGLHGPDICLYYEPMTFNAVKKNCFSLHKQYADELFKHSATHIQESINQDAYKVYLIGFICHYALDSICHPYVEKIISLEEVSHTDLETNLDRYFMLADGLDPMKHFPITHINPSDENSKIIKLFYPSLTVDEVKTCLEGMIEATKFFHATNTKRLEEIYLLLHDNNCYGPMSGLVMGPEANPVCDKYYALFDKLYKKAVPFGVKLINEFITYLEQGTDLSEDFHFTFGAGDDWESLKI